MGLYEFHGDTKPTTGYLKFMKMWLEDKFISKSENIKIRSFFTFVYHWTTLIALNQGFVNFLLALLKIKSIQYFR